MKLGQVCAATSGSVLLMAAGSNASKVAKNNVYKSIGSLFRGRNLQDAEDLTIKRCWEECIANGGMTAEECKALIESEIPGHEIPDLMIKIRTPRDEPTFNGSYWYIGIPTNYYGETTCDVNNAVIRFPFDWEVPIPGGSEVVSIPDTDCKAMMADECCSAIMENMAASNIPTVDINGNCLACWVHAVPLEPVTEIGGIGYNDHEYVTTPFGPGVCQETFISQADIQAGDDANEAELVDLAGELQLLVDDGEADCSTLLDAQNLLYLATRNVLKTRIIIADMLCGICDGPTETIFPLPEALISDLETIIAIFLGTTIKNDENCIIIYTDADMNVIEPPKIGGSRKNIDWNLGDNCDDAPPVDPDPITDPDTCTPNDPPSPAFCETAHFDPATTVCNGPTCTEVDAADYPDYSITYNMGSDMLPNPQFIVVKGQLRTRFYYTVCTGDEPVENVMIGWVGVCAVTNYQYRSYAFEGTEHGYFGGMDDATCVAGFGFTESFENVPDYGGCAELMMEIDGHVAVSQAVDVSLQFNGKFTKYVVKGADCTLCDNPPTIQG
jgi:hypothetical protein